MKDIAKAPSAATAVVTVASRYDVLDAERQNVLIRARDCALMTIPALLPPLGANQNTPLPTPFNGMGARGVNNLGSKLLMALLPPNTPFFRLNVQDSVLEKFGKNRPTVEAALAKIEKSVLIKSDTSNLRTTIFEACKHLIVAGNGLVFVPKDMKTRFYRLDQFVVVRDVYGNVKEIIVRESVNPTALERDICEIHEIDPDSKTPCQVYTHIIIKDGRAKSYQEINEKRVADTDGDYPSEAMPWIVMRWQAVAGENYGRGLCEEYLGDLRTLEGLRKAIVQFAAAAAKIVFLRKPNATTSSTAITQAESGDVKTGTAEDFTILQIEKGQDFSVAKATSDAIAQGLAACFLLQDGMTRDAERVTAQEIREVAQQLEDALGGIYTVQAQEFQLPLVRRLMSIMQATKEIPFLPKKVVNPMITTGFAALGRNADLNKLTNFMQIAEQTLGQQVVAQYIDVPTYLKQIGNGTGVDTSFVKTAQQVQAEQNAQLANQTISDAASGPVGAAVAQGQLQQPNQ